MAVYWRLGARGEGGLCPLNCSCTLNSHTGRDAVSVLLLLFGMKKAGLPARPNLSFFVFQVY